MPAELYGALHTGMTAQILPDSLPDAQLHAEVTIVDKVIDAASGTYGVRLKLNNPNYKIPGGLKCKVRFSKENASRI